MILIGPAFFKFLELPISKSRRSSAKGVRYFAQGYRLGGKGMGYWGLTDLEIQRAKL
jgi:hypothetical protein